MDAKLREDLFRRYVASLERRLEQAEGRINAASSGHAATTASNGGAAAGSVSSNGLCRGNSGRHSTNAVPTTTHSSSEEALISTATALLGAYQAEPSQRFRLLHFYEVAENALRSAPRGSSLRALEAAFATLETVCTNLLLFPWKKEFRCIKTFTGPYVYQLQSAMCESDLRSLLRSMGYTRGSEQDTHYQAREVPVPGSTPHHHLQQLAFELLLAQAECRLLGEVVALSRGAANELEALELRRASREDAAGCAETLRRRDSLTGAIDLARLSLRPAAEAERAPTPHHHLHHANQQHHHPHHLLRRSGRPSKSVDVTDSAGHWHPASSKPVLRASLSLRKEPLFVDAEPEEARDEILRPNAPLFSLASTPSFSSSSSSSVAAGVGSSTADFFPIQSPPPPSDPYSYHLSSLDEVDLYTERGVGSSGGGLGLAGGRHTPSSSSASASSSSRPPSREPRDSWLLKAHVGGGAKCQGCGLGCSVLSSCPRCDSVLCSSCLACEPMPCCGSSGFGLAVGGGYHQDYPKPLSRQLDGYLPPKEKLSVYSNSHSHMHSHTHPHSHALTHTHTHAHTHLHPHPHPLSHSHPQLLDKPMLSSTKLYPSKPIAMVTTSGPSSVERLGSSSSRCGFCNKPGAAYTCVNCSKVSCDSCMGLYTGDVCTRKTPHHTFLPNHQLNFKASTMSHLVYR